VVPTNQPIFYQLAALQAWGDIYLGHWDYVVMSPYPFMLT